MESLPILEGLLSPGKDSLTSSVLGLSEMMESPGFAESCLSPLRGAGGKHRPTPPLHVAEDELEEGEIPSEDGSDEILDLSAGLLDDTLWSPTREEGQSLGLSISMTPASESPAAPGHSLRAPGSSSMAAALQAIPDLQIPLGSEETAPDIVRGVRRSLLGEFTRASQLSSPTTGGSQGSSLADQSQPQACHLAAQTGRGSSPKNASRPRPGEGYLRRLKARRARQRLVQRLALNGIPFKVDFGTSGRKEVFRTRRV